MESCARVIAMFPGYAEGELPPRDSGRVSAHLEGCGACAARVRRHQDLLAALDGLPQVVPPDGFRASVMNRVMAAPLRASHPRPRHLRLVKAVFWAVLACAAGSAGLAGACLRCRGFMGKIAFLDPSLCTERVEGAGRAAFSFLVGITTRAAVPGALPSPHSSFAWGGFLSALVLSALIAGALGLGVLATARVLLSDRGR